MALKEQFVEVGGGLLVRAPAKINLSLLIAGKRPDGFHEIKTIMAKVDWYDEILIENSSDVGTELVCRGKYEVPEGKDNLVYKAAELFFERTGLAAKVKITLTKNLPAGSGLGGASSDAAAILMGLKKFFSVDISTEKVAEMAAQLGSDVAFFLGGPLAFCGGRGEKIEKIEKKFDFSALLVLPDVIVSTKRVYANYLHNEELFRKLDSKINACLEKNNIALLVTLCANMLLESCLEQYATIKKYKEEIESLKIEGVCLSGSGSTMYKVFTDSEAKNIENVQSKIANRIGCETIIVNNNRW